MPAEITVRPWKFHVEPFRIIDRLYYVGNRDVSSHLIDTGQGLILLDTTYQETVYLLLESIRRLGFDPDDISFIVHCHAHYDHCGGTRAIVELTGAKTLLGEADVELLEQRPELSWGPEYGVEFEESFKVDRLLRDGDVVSLGNVAIECVHIPGHTPGSMAFFFAVGEAGKSYTVGIHGGPGLNTLTDEYLARYGLPASRRQDYLASLEKLKPSKVDIQLGAHPGQNDTLAKRAAMTPDRNPFIDPQAWPGYLADLEAKAKSTFGLI